MRQRLQLTKLVLAVVLGLAILVPTILLMTLLAAVASIPSAIGYRAPVEGWFRSGLNRVIDVQRMKMTRDDLFYAIRPGIEFTDDIERWAVIREMETSLERTERAMKSGEFVLTILFGLLSIVAGFIAPPLLAGLFLLLLTVGLGALVLLRTVTIDILSYDPRMYLEEPTDELALRMAWNKGPMSGLSALLIVALALIRGATGYELGLGFIGWYAEETRPSDGSSKWSISDSD